MKESTSRKAHSTSGILPTSAPSWSDTTDIQSAGVLQDQESSAVSQPNSGTWPDTMQVFEFWEIFAGCGKLSSCLQSEGFTILPVDSDDMEHTPLVPIFFADLREPAAQHQLLERIKTTPPVGMHLAMLCGTGSRAREQPISATKRKIGVPQLPPLRSADYPMGLPHLKPFHQAKIDSANTLLRFVVELLFLAFQLSVHVVLENPERSWIWAALTF